MTASGQSPVQDGNDSHSDLPSTRNTWEVPAEKVRVNSPSWIRLLGSVLGGIEDNMGVSSMKERVTMAPSLILYQPGSTVKPCPAYVEPQH